MTTGPYTDIDFVLSSSEGRGDFIGISGSGLDKAGIGVFVSDCTDADTQTNFLSKSAGTILNVYNGPYQYASWQQVRNSYNPIVRKLVENSILTIAATPGIQVPPQTGLPVSAKREGVWCYKLPVVTNNSKPLEHVMEVQPNINDPTITTSSFSYTYNNNIQLFADTAIENELGIGVDNPERWRDPDSMYNNISPMYLDSSQLTSNTNPVRDFVKINYSEVLYPSAINAFLNRTRTRTNYAEVPGRGNDGYDRIFGTQRTFFKDNQIRNFGVALNSQGYGPAPAGTGSELVDSLSFNPMATDGIRSYPDSASYRNYDGELMMDTDITMNRYKPVPSLAFNEENYLYNEVTYLSGVFYSTDIVAAEYIYSRSKLSDTDWSEPFQVYSSPDDYVNGIAVDSVNRKVYWTEFSHDPDRIMSSSFDGSDSGLVCNASSGTNTGDVRGIDVSPSRDRIVWCNRGSTDDIGTASLDGSLSGTIFSDLNDPYDVVIDQRDGKLYWIGANAATGSSERAWTGNLDGTGYAPLNSPIQDLLVTATGYEVMGIDLDPVSNLLYFIGEFPTNELRIYKSDLNGDNPDLVLTQPAAAFDAPVEVRVDPHGRRLYFTSWQTDLDMYSCSLDHPGLDPISNLYGKAFDGPVGGKIAKAALHFAKLSASSGYVERLTEKISGRNPWYNTYENYADDVRPENKGMSILPEFRISDFIDYYVNENSNDFRARNDKFLLLDGAYITASAAETSSSIDTSFISKYAESSKANKLSKIIEEHGDIANIGRIEISCKAIKKLLPYNGFYPQNRTVQLGNLLSQSMAPNISGREDGNPTGPRRAQGLQGILKPLVSPGILYNSLKSGIAVDYPMYMGPRPTTSSANPFAKDPSDFQLTQAPDFRLPFESIINFEGNLPVGNADSDINGLRLLYSDALSGHPDSLDSFKYKTYWDGNKKSLFELGMHNFLAETVDFFLEGDDKGGKLTSFRSQPQPEDGWVLDANKTYYMDVKLSDTAPMNRFVEYDGVKTINDFNWNYARPPRQYGMFGFAQKTLYGADGALYAAITSPISLDGGINFVTSTGLFKRVNNGSGWKQLVDLPNPYLGESDPADPFVGTEGSKYGWSVDMLSSSDGFFIIVGDPGANDNSGRATVFTTNQEKIINTTLVTASDNPGGIEFGSRVGIAYDGARYWFACSAPEDRRFATNGYAVYLYNSSSVHGYSIPPVTASKQPNQAILQCDEYLGAPSLNDLSIIHGKTVDPDNVFGGNSYIYVLASQTGGGPDLNGSASLWACTGSPAAVEYPRGTDLRTHALNLTASEYTPGGTGFKFGRSTALLTASDGLYAAIGQSTIKPASSDTYGKVYIYRYSDHSPSAWIAAGIQKDPTGEWFLTCSAGNSYTGQYMGACSFHESLGGYTQKPLNMVSGSDGLKIVGGTYQGQGKPTIEQEPAGPWLFTVPVISPSPSAVTPPEEQGLITSESLGFSSSYISRFPYDVNDGEVIHAYVNSENIKLNAYGFTVDIASGTKDMSMTVCNAYGKTFGRELSGWTLTFQSSSAGGLFYSSSYSDVLYKYKQHGKLYGLAMEEEFPYSNAKGSYDPAYCAYTPPCFYGDAISRLSFTPSTHGPHSLNEILDGMKVENILNVDADRMAVIDNDIAGLTNLQKQVKMPLSSSVNFRGVTKIPQTTTLPDGTTQTIESTPGDPDAWVISTRFESPVIDTKNPKYDQLYTANNDEITGTFGWQTVMNPITVIEDSLPFTIRQPYGIAIDVSSQKIYWTDYDPAALRFPAINRVNVDGTDPEHLIDFTSTVGLPFGIALDEEVSLMYYADRNIGIYRAPMFPGAESEMLVDTSHASVHRVCDIKIDVGAGKMYWTDNISSPELIQRANMEIPSGETPSTRTDIETIVSLPSAPYVAAIALDVASGKIYWTQEGDGKIRRANMQPNADIEEIVTSPGAQAFGIVLDSRLNKLYWIDNSTDLIYRINKDGTGDIETMVDTPLGNGVRMTIDSAKGKLYWADDTLDRISSAYANLHTEHNPRTMWTSYGTVPAGNEGIKLELKESFPELTPVQSQTTSSLIDVCGFQSAVPKNVGQIRQTKEISEAIVVIPYLDSAASQEITTTAGNETTQQQFTVTPENGPGNNFIRIPKWSFDGQKKNIEDGKSAVPGAENVISGIEYKTTTISDMIGMMKKYIIPPNLDFVKYEDIDPFVMYIFEFNHILKREELADMWQGVMPQSALKMENDEVIISHKISPFEFFGNIQDQKVLGKMKYFVFKVKKKGKQNYYKMTEDSKDDVRFKFSFANDSVGDATPPGGNYNWPYDFFSLIEKAKVETKFTIKKKTPPPPPTVETETGE